MNINKKLKIDLQNPGSTPIVYAVQNDTNVRSLTLELLNGRSPFFIPKNVRVVIRYNRSDGTGGEFDTLSDDTIAWSAKRNILQLEIFPALVSVPGSVDVTVSLLSADQHLSVFPIRLHVDSVAAPDVAAPENYFYVTGFIPAPESAEKGQYLCVSEVNSSGKVTAVEAADPPTGSGGTVDEATVQNIVDSYLAANPPLTVETDPTVPDWAKQSSKPSYTPEEIGAQPKGNYVQSDQLQETIQDALNQANESGQFRGEDGKSAYDYAQDAGYSGSEETFAKKLAQETIYVTVTADENGNYSVDKTAVELIQAYENGHTLSCIADIDGLLAHIPLLACFTEDGQNGLLFTAAFGGFSIFVMIIDLGGDDYVELQIVEPEIPAYTPEKLIMKIGNYPQIVYDGTQTSTLIIPDVKNPYPLTLNNIPYDGSVAVDITETVNSMIDTRIPGKLPNPSVLTINGISYDGTQPVEIHIADGNGTVAGQILSDNLFDKTAVLPDKWFYHSSSGVQLMDSSDISAAYVALRGAGTYRTKVTVSFLSENYAQRVPLVNEDKTWLQNISGTLTDTGDRSAWDLEFTVTQDMIDAGAKYYTLSVENKHLDTLMMVKDRAYPTQYIPYGYVNGETAMGDAVKQDNVLYGKTAVFLGASVCAADMEGSEYDGWGWAGLIGDANGMIWQNFGRNGGTITPVESSVAQSIDLHSQANLALSAYPNADYILFEGGSHDADLLSEAGLGVISGDFANFDTSTFSGAMESLILKILTDFPNTRVGYIVTQKMGMPPYSGEDNMRRRYFDRAVEICRKWGIPVIDLWYGSHLNPALPYHAENFYTDGQHLTLAGYQTITPRIEAFLRSI